MFHDLEAWIRAGGYLFLFAVVFAESGLLVGFFLPGDSLLFTAGFLASQGVFEIIPLLLIVFTAAVLGDNVGYLFGNKVGPKIFKRKDSLLFDHEHLERSEKFYAEHGAKTLVLARFMPVVRTFAPILAGVGKMHYRTFMVFNLVGAFLWAVCVTLAGYYLGKTIPDVDRYLLPIIALIVIASVAPSVYHILKDPKQRAKIKYQFSKIRSSKK